MVAPLSDRRYVIYPLTSDVRPLACARSYSKENPAVPCITARLLCGVVWIKRPAGS
jgi:hypothetical protein